jgi:hypothetical protein
MGYGETKINVIKKSANAMAQHVILLLRDLKCLFNYSRNVLEHARQFSEAKTVESFQNW